MCIRIKSSKIQESLNCLSTNAKSQWCVEVEPDKYLGLTKEGPRIFSSIEWVTLLERELQSFAQSPPMSKRDKIERYMVKTLFDAGLNEWIVLKGLLNAPIRKISSRYRLQE